MAKMEDYSGKHSRAEVITSYCAGQGGTVVTRIASFDSMLDDPQSKTGPEGSHTRDGLTVDPMGDATCARSVDQVVGHYAVDVPFSH
jgi:hypothetical protein